MNTVIVAALALASMVISAPTDKPDKLDKPIAILSQEQDIGPDGSFNVKFETENGISEQFQGSLKQIDQDTQAQVIQGSASWTAPDGTPIQIAYIADENGYQPESSVLPTAPVIPVAIQRALEYIAAHPQTTQAVPE